MNNLNTFNSWNSSRKHSEKCEINWINLFITADNCFCFAGVNIPLAWSKVQILDRTSKLFGKAVLMQDFCGGSDQSKLWATRFSGFGLFTLFNWNKHRHLSMSWIYLKQNTEDSLSKFHTDHLQSGEEKKEERFPAM
jgi:hypothetical protein